MREDEGFSNWPLGRPQYRAEPHTSVDDIDVAWTREEKRSLKIVIIVIVIVALVSCGSGIGIGVAFA